MKLKNLTLWIAACALAVSMASCGSDEPEPNIPGNNNNNNNQGGGYGNNNLPCAEKTDCPASP